MIIFLISYQTTGCDPSPEPFYRDGSDEGSQHAELTKFTPNTPSYLERWN